MLVGPTRECRPTTFIDGAVSEDGFHEPEEAGFSVEEQRIGKQTGRVEVDSESAKQVRVDDVEVLSALADEEHGRSLQQARR